MNTFVLDEPGILALNRLHEAETSPLDLAALRNLVAQSFHLGLRGAGRDAFLIALSQDADYASPNFNWFKRRYRQFVYVDRVIVAEALRVKGLARGLYEDLFLAARRSEFALVCCEVNLDPPNPASEALHAVLGFRDVGRARLTAAKAVRYLARDL